MPLVRLRRPEVLRAAAVSRSQVKRGRRAGRQAARIPVFNSMLEIVNTHGHNLVFGEVLLIPYLVRVVTVCEVSF